MVPPFIPHLDTLWSSRSSSPWSWRSPRRSSTSHTRGPSSSQWSNSSSPCPGSISPNNLQTPCGSFPEWQPPAASRQTPQRIPSRGGQARPLKWNTNLLVALMYNFLFLTVFIPALSHSWLWEGEVGIPAKTVLSHRSPCDLEFLCPSPVSSPSVSLQKQVCRATYSTEHPIPALIRLPCLSHCVCGLSLRAGVTLSLLVPSWAPPFSRSHKGGDNDGEGGVGWWVWRVFCLLLLLSLLPLSHLVLLLFTLFLSYALPAELPWPWSAGLAQSLSATPDLRVLKEREECEQLAGLQTIVPGGLLSAVKPPFGSHLSPFFSFSYYCYCNLPEIPTLQTWLFMLHIVPLLNSFFSFYLCVTKKYH